MPSLAKGDTRVFVVRVRCRREEEVFVADGDEAARLLASNLIYEHSGVQLSSWQEISAWLETNSRTLDITVDTTHIWLAEHTAAEELAHASASVPGKT